MGKVFFFKWIIWQIIVNNKQRCNFVKKLHSLNVKSLWKIKEYLIGNENFVVGSLRQILTF